MRDCRSTNWVKQTLAVCLFAILVVPNTSHAAGILAEDLNGLVAEIRASVREESPTVMPPTTPDQHVVVEHGQAQEGVFAGYLDVAFDDQLASPPETVQEPLHEIVTEIDNPLTGNVRLVFKDDGLGLEFDLPDDFIEDPFPDMPPADKTSLFTAVFQPDPAIYFAFEMTNTTDVAVRAFLELLQQLPDLETTGDAQFGMELSVQDNNDDGAMASASGFFTTQQDSDTPGVPLNTILPLGDGGFGNYLLEATDQTPDSDDNLLNGISFGASGMPVIGQAMTMDLVLSPGDTAFVKGFFAIGDINNPLPSNSTVQTVSDAVMGINAGLREFIAIPEPSTFLLSAICFCGFVARKRNWKKRSDKAGQLSTA